MLDLSKMEKNIFWNKVNNEKPGLENACGCYLFAYKAGKGITPDILEKLKDSLLREKLSNPINFRSPMGSGLELTGYS